MEMAPRCFAELTGETTFAMVPMEIRHPLNDDASGVMFTLGGRTYLVFEDPSDGYRSHAGPLLGYSGNAYDIGYGSRFPEYLNEEVLCSHRSFDGHGNEDDVLEVRSKATGKVIFEIGTCMVDDYYPYFHWIWSPENLSANTHRRQNNAETEATKRPAHPRLGHLPPAGRRRD